MRRLLVFSTATSSTLLLLSWMTLCSSFVQKPSRAATMRLAPRMFLSYLDSLSQPHEEDNDEKGKKPPSPKQSWQPNTPTSGGCVPSGRGPQSSYLEEMTQGTSKGTREDDQDEQDIPTKEPKRTSTDFVRVSYLDVALNEDDSRTNVRSFLTQRAIQSFLFLLEQCRDPHSAKWIEQDLLESSGLLEFHGTGAGFLQRMGGTWQAPLLEMMERPKETIVVSAKRRGRGHGGWSKNNPFLEERFVEIPIDVDPVSLASRILSVREQIAAEWQNDLDIVHQANNMILDSYFSQVRSGRDDRARLGEAIGSVDVAFERTAMNLMNNSTAFSQGASSPFRKGNFDLLYNLCTQASIHRLLREYKAAGSDKEWSFAWLLDFYSVRAADFFDGDLPYGRADDFVDELLQTPPAVVSREDQKTGLADPLGTTEDIIRMRNEVVNDWKMIMAHVADDHAEIRRVLLTKQMQSWGGDNAGGSELGAFE